MSMSGSIGASKTDRLGKPLLGLQRVVVSIADPDPVPYVTAEDVVLSIGDLENKKKKGTSGGFVYVFGLTKKGTGGDVPWYIGETAENKLVKRCKAGDDINKMNDIVVKHSAKGNYQSKLVIWVIDCEIMNRVARKNLETVIIQQAVVTNPELLNKMKTGNRVPYYLPEYAIAGVQDGPLRCSGQIGSKEERDLGFNFQKTIGWK